MTESRSLLLDAYPEEESTDDALCVILKAAKWWFKGKRQLAANSHLQGHEKTPSRAVVTIMSRRVHAR